MLQWVANMKFRWRTRAQPLRIGCVCGGQAIEITGRRIKRLRLWQLPQPTSPVGAMKITADFVDSAGKPVTGLGIGVSQDGGTPVMGMVDSKGRFVLNQGGLGNFLWGILPANMSEDQAILVDTEIQQERRQRSYPRMEARMVQTPEPRKSCT